MKCVHEVHAMNILQVSYVHMLTLSPEKNGQTAKKLGIGVYIKSWWRIFL